MEKRKAPFKGITSAKKHRGDWDDEDAPSTFEAELAMFDDIEAEEKADSQNMHTSGAGPENQTTSVKWCRPPLEKPIDPKKDSITFQQIDVDHYTGSHMVGMPGCTAGPVPIIRMYGITMEGHSVMAHIHGFTPYFFVPAPAGFQDQHCNTFMKALNAVVIKDMRSTRDNIVHAVLAVEMTKKESIYGYQGNRKIPFLKITVAIPRLLAPCKRLLEQGFAFDNFNTQGYQSYESNVEFEIRQV